MATKSMIAEKKIVMPAEGQVFRIRSIKMSYIVRITAQTLFLEAEDILSPKRHRVFSEARFIAMSLACKYSNTTLSEIGKYFGGRDHTTVIYGRQMAEDMRRYDKKFRSKIEAVENAL